jgi:hypothetical protein
LDKADLKQQQVVVMFQDFSFKTPEQIMGELKPNASSTMHSMDAAPVAANASAPKMAMDHAQMMAKMGAESMSDMDMDMSDSAEHAGHMDMAMDLNDVEYDA